MCRDDLHRHCRRLHPHNHVESSGTAVVESSRDCIYESLGAHPVWALPATNGDNNDSSLYSRDQGSPQKHTPMNTAEWVPTQETRSSSTLASSDTLYSWIHDRQAPFQPISGVSCEDTLLHDSRQVVLPDSLGYDLNDDCDSESPKWSNPQLHGFAAPSVSPCHWDSTSSQQYNDGNIQQPETNRVRHRDELCALLLRLDEALLRLRSQAPSAQDHRTFSDVVEDVKALFANHKWPAIKEVPVIGKANGAHQANGKAPLYIPNTNSQHLGGDKTYDKQFGSSPGDLPRTDVSMERKPDTARYYRCHYHFVPDTTGVICNYAAHHIRDLHRQHLRTHEVYFCATCSRHFRGRDAARQFANHSHDDPVCVDSSCPHKEHLGDAHRWTEICARRFNALNPRTKWCSLFALVFPGVPPPPWCDVVINADGSPYAALDRTPRALRPLSDVSDSGPAETRDPAPDALVRNVGLGTDNNNNNYDRSQIDWASVQSSMHGDESPQRIAQLRRLVQEITNWNPFAGQVGPNPITVLQDRPQDTAVPDFDERTTDDGRSMPNLQQQIRELRQETFRLQQENIYLRRQNSNLRQEIKQQTATSQQQLVQRDSQSQQQLRQQRESYERRLLGVRMAVFRIAAEGLSSHNAAELVAEELDRVHMDAQIDEPGSNDALSEEIDFDTPRPEASESSVLDTNDSVDSSTSSFGALSNPGSSATGTSIAESASDRDSNHSSVRKRKR